MTWEDIKIGVESGSIDMIVTDEMIDEYSESMECDYQAFLRDAESTDRIVPPDMVPKLAMRPLFTNYLNQHIGKGVRAKQAFKFHHPVQVGMRVRAVGYLVDKYERRDKRFVSFEALFESDVATPLLTDRRSIMVVQPNFLMRE
jgi:hypothetical protein